MKKLPHRGRFQAQGDGLEESESWAQNAPLSVDEALELIDQLEEKIPDKEHQMLENPLEKARAFVLEAGNYGGVNAPISKTFKVQKSRSLRIDIEVHAGQAFIELNLEDDD